MLDNRSVVSARASVDHLVVGPTGLFVVDQKPWPGQMSVSGDHVYVDGRMRAGVTDDVTRATTAVQDILGHELKPVGATVRSVIVFDSATNPSFEAAIGKVALAARRSAAKVIRAGQPTSGAGNGRSPRPRGRPTARLTSNPALPLGRAGAVR